MLRIGRVAGVPVYLSLSWFLVALLIAYLFIPVIERQVPGLGVWAYPAGLVFAVLLYASVLLHEISHVVVARRFGLPVHAITVQFLGGVSELGRDPDSAWREFAVAVVGPLTSLAIGGAALGVGLLVDGPALVVLFIGQLALANVLVGLFNLLPGLPLDGGRILRAGVWAVTRRPHVATTVAGWAGRVMAVLVVLAPWLLLRGTSPTPSLVHVVWSVLIATFLWAGSSQAMMTARVRRRLPDLQARQLARRGLPVGPDVSVAEGLRLAEQADAGALLVVDRENRPVGIVNEAAALATPEHRRPWVSVGEVSRRIEAGLILSSALAGEELVRAMGGTPASEYLVVDPTGQVYGVLSSADVNRVFANV